MNAKHWFAQDVRALRNAYAALKEVRAEGRKGYYALAIFLLVWPYLLFTDVVRGKMKREWIRALGYSTGGIMCDIIGTMGWADLSYFIAISASLIFAALTVRMDF